jgi:hypothetical protein
MAGIELCKFTHGLGLYMLILPRVIALGVKLEYKALEVKLEYKGPAHV